MFKYILLLNALIISAVAAYYSILGLIVIFAASAIPVAVMASSLEVGKLMTATYLHNHWKETGIVLKTYLTMAVAILMLITSLGIFGFLSKAHIEQGLDGKQVSQQIEQIDRQIAKLETDAEMSVQRANEMIASKTLQINNEIEVINSQIRASQRNLDALTQATQINDVRSIQTIVGVNVDGRFGPNTENAVQAFKLREETKIKEFNGRVQELNDRLEKDLKTISTLDVSQEVKALTQQRFDLEKQVTKLEAEVGPIKYVAEVVYGESNNDLLEQAVRWMIIIIVLVFDPLAIALLLAYNTLNKKGRKDAEVVKENTTEVEGYDLSEYIFGYYDSERGDSEYAGKVEKEQTIAAPSNKLPSKFKKRRGKHAEARKGIRK